MPVADQPPYLLDLGDAALGVAAVGLQQPEGDPGVQFGVAVVGGPGQFDGAAGDGDALGAGLVDHDPAGDHARAPRRAWRTAAVRSTSSRARDSSSQPSPRPRYLGDRERCDPEPGGTQRVRAPLRSISFRRALGDGVGAFALAAEAGGDGDLGQQVDEAERGAGAGRRRSGG